MALDLAVLAVHRHAGEVTHVLVGAGELVEQRGLAAVLLSCQCECQFGTLRERVLVSGIMVLACLTQAGVRVVLVKREVVAEIYMLLLRGHIGLAYDLLLHGDLSRLLKSERERIPAYEQLHGIAHRSEL